MSSKKTKTSSGSEMDEWQKVKDYLLKCPHVSPDHPAVQAALKGMEHEQKRKERDAKLRQKFAASSDNTKSELVATPAFSQTSQATAETPEAMSAEKHQSQKSNPTSMSTEDETMSDDWQDVNEENAINRESSGSSYLGDRLAAEAVQLIAQRKVQVSSPIAAIAAALHASLISLGFVCTGIPEEGPSTGFAPPVRALTDQFLPDQWDTKNPYRVILRYRQDDVGSVNLIVESKESETVQVTWNPSKTSEPGPANFTFALQDHINLDSWKMSSQNFAKRTEPALHYKSLSLLLTLWAQKFDLGESLLVNDSEGAKQQPLYTDSTIQQLPASLQVRTEGKFSSHPQPVLPQRPVGTTGPDMIRPSSGGYQVPTTLDGAFPMRGVHGLPGQFSGDLFPGNPENGGNLMGPGHPAFGSGSGGLTPGGFLQPRYDPYGPPGGPTDPNNPNHPARPRVPPNTGGDPNNDHFRPPNNLNNNMFM